MESLFSFPVGLLHPLQHAGCSENTYRLIVSGGVDSELSLIATWGCNKSETPSAAPGAAAAVDRTVLPLAEPTYPAITELDLKAGGGHSPYTKDNLGRPSGLAVGNRLGAGQAGLECYGEW
jgi:hypothetical protein